MVGIWGVNGGIMVGKCEARLKTKDHRYPARSVPESTSGTGLTREFISPVVCESGGVFLRGGSMMRKAFFAAAVFLLLYGPAFAGGGLDGFLDSLNVRARADMEGFSVQVSAQFGVPLPQVQAVVRSVAAPADAFMCFQLGSMSGSPYERVVQVYQTKRGKGWGVVARSLGIKPGSPEFHALKAGDFVLNGEPVHGGLGTPPGKGGGKGRGKGHNK
jgi:hypothetical protein